MFNPIKAAGDAAKAVGDVAKKAAGTAADAVRDPGKAFNGAVNQVRDTAQDIAKNGVNPGKALDGVQTALDVAGFVPGVGIAADLANAGISAARGDMAGAALNAAAAIPILGDAAKGAKMVAKGVDAATTAAKGVDAAADAAKAAGVAGDAAKAGDVAKAADAAKAAESAAAMNKLRTQGHGPQRHGPQVTPQQLDDRVTKKLDPETGTRADNYRTKADGTPANHKCGDHATKFTSDEAYVKAEGSMRDTAEFKDKAAAGATDISVTQKLEDVFGPNYKADVAGRSRTTPWPDTTTPSVTTDFTDGTAKAIYSRNASGQYDLVTMYPEPKLP